MRKHIIWSFNKDMLQDYLDTSSSYNEMFTKLNLKVSKSLIKMINYRIKVDKIDKTKFIENTTKKRIDRFKEYSFKQINIDKILIENSTYTSSGGLKNKLIKNGLLEYQCSICNLNKWLNKEIVLQLDHINGKNNDNRIQNLRLLCPNCHSQTDTYAGKKKKEKKKLNYCCKCGCHVQNKVFCEDCDNEMKIKKRKVDRPKYDDLLIEIKNYGYSATGRKYGVSDVAIRKWKIKYEKDIKKLVV